MESPELSFTLAYIVFCLCFVFTPNEFRSAGLTIQNLFSSWLGSEDVAFVQFHIRRTSVTVLVHSALPLGKTWQSLSFMQRLYWSFHVSNFIIIYLLKTHTDRIKGKLHQNITERCEVEWETVMKRACREVEGTKERPAEHLCCVLEKVLHFEALYECVFKRVDGNTVL